MHSFIELIRQFEDRFSATLPFAATPENLYDPCRYLLAAGGKRIRPVLCLMGNELFDDIGEDAWHGAMAVELFHNFTLIHDDIMDKAPLRRGMPTVHEKYGLTAGILCGDVMSIHAYEQLAKIKHALPEVLALFSWTAIEVCEGQQLDMDFEQRNNVTIDEYITMITLKTSVLLACALKMGALVGGGLGDSANKLYAFGKNLGIAFQLQDDYLDAYGDPAKSGKQVGGDIKANKKTYLLLKALQNADSQRKKEIEALLAGESEDKVNAMLAIYTLTRADMQCKEAMKYYADKAFDALDDVAIPSKRKQPLMELAHYLLERDK